MMLATNDKTFEQLARQNGLRVPGGGTTSDGIHYDFMVDIQPEDDDFEEILNKVLDGLIEAEVIEYDETEWEEDVIY